MRIFSEHIPAGAVTVDDGIVRCPIQGHDVDVEECYTCRLRKDMGITGDQTWIRCRLDASDLFGAGLIP